jgi:CheY-like chemotaxis protein
MHPKVTPAIIAEKLERSDARGGRRPASARNLDRTFDRPILINLPYTICRHLPAAHELPVGGMVVPVVTRTIGKGQILDTSHQPTRVIVADDDPLIRSILKSNLEAVGQEVLLAHNGLEAVALASQTQASLVVLDIRMRRMDGLRACAEIRRLPGYASTPIVMLTFDDGASAQTQATRAGATMFLIKPFGSAALMLALSKYLTIDAETQKTVLDTAMRATGGKAFARMRS